MSDAKTAWVTKQVDHVYPRLLETDTPASREALTQLFSDTWDENHRPRAVVFSVCLGGAHD